MSATKKRELYSLSPGCQRFYQLKASLFVFIFCQASKHVFLQGLNPCNVLLHLQKSRLEAGFFFTLASGYSSVAATSRSTNSTIAIGALSPTLKPVLRMRM